MNQISRARLVEGGLVLIPVIFLGGQNRFHLAAPDAAATDGIPRTAAVASFDPDLGKHPRPAYTFTTSL
jgi:hypothetical protein